MSRVRLAKGLERVSRGRDGGILGQERAGGLMGRQGLSRDLGNDPELLSCPKPDPG